MRDSPVPARSSVSQEAVIGVRGLEAGFGDRMVLRGVDLDLYRGEILGVVGASGSGKSVLLRSLLSLMPKRAGTIEISGVNVEDIPFEARRQLEQRLGVLFQFGALISSITVKENVQLMMREHLRLSEELNSSMR
jgi:phospholipid/cholesterol/gamma-HCH transport system ATP-binding protein